MKSKVLFYIILFLIWTPFLQIFIFYKAVPELNGSIGLRQKPVLTDTTWFGGIYQTSFEDYINDHIGCRPFFVRLKNQICYSLFDEVHVNGVVGGKKAFLYELNYIKAYNGDDFLGNSAIKSQVEKLKVLQDVLATYNKTLIVCLAPGKASFYPEYLPDEYVKPKTFKTNYHVFAQEFVQQNINHVDFNGWFLKMKDTCDCPLYPQYGIHWSTFGSTLATDSLVKYVEGKRKIDMANLITTSIAKTTNPHIGDDYDIGNAMNLLVDTIRNQTMCYPVIEWQQGTNFVKPKLLTIGDSYFWGLFRTGLPVNSFSLGAFWYYNTQVYTVNKGAADTTTDQLDLRNEILKNDVILIIATEASLTYLGLGFVDSALKVLQKAPQL